MRSLLLYTALLCGAIAVPVLAQEANPIDIEAAHQAGMTKLVDSFPTEVPDEPFTDLDGTDRKLSDYKGTAILVNFWATWCAPCREEMPSLQSLQQQVGGDDFKVLTIAAGRNSPEGIRKFFEEEGLTDLPTLTDPKMGLARSMGVVGVPVSVLIDAEGREVARVSGEADWSIPAAVEAVRQLTAD